MAEDTTPKPPETGETGPRIGRDEWVARGH